MRWTTGSRRFTVTAAQSGRHGRNLHPHVASDLPASRAAPALVVASWRPALRARAVERASQVGTSAIGFAEALLSGVRPAGQRRPRNPHPEYAGRGLPAPVQVLGSDLTALMMIAFHHARSDGYRQQGLRYLADFMTHADGVEENGMVGAVLLWLQKRLMTAWPTSVSGYLSMVRELARRLRPEVYAALTDWVVSDFMAAVTKIWGPAPAVRGATPMPEDVYVRALRSTSDVATRAAIAITWLRGARVADTLSTRRGGLWRPTLTDLPQTQRAYMSLHPEVVILALELVGIKGYRLGIVDSVYLYVPTLEMEILKGMVVDTRPMTPPHSRPLMFPGMTTAAIANALAAYGPYTAHSLRKGRISQWIAMGFSLHQVAMLSMHRGMESLMRYTGRPDDATVATQLRLSGTSVRRSELPPEGLFGEEERR